MPTYTFTLYELDNHPGVPTGSTSASDPFDLTTTTGSLKASVATITIEDDDSELDDFFTNPANSNSGGDVGDQQLVSDVTIGSTTYVSGTSVYSIARVEVNNLTTGESGYALIVNFGDDILADDSYFLFTISVQAGDSIEYVRTNNTTSDPTYGFGDEPYANIPCFVSGSLIKGTDQIPKPIESLSIGDLVLTSSGDLRAIRWIGSRKFDAIDLAANPKLRPVRIRAGALGENMPEEDLWVSRQHRVLVRSAIAQRMFGTDEVLIPAIKLIELDGIDVDEEMQEVEYYHLLFDQHEIIYSNGAWTESLFTGPEALKAVSPEARKEIETIFPEICEPEFKPTPARHIPQKGKRMKQLIARHKKNQKPIFKI